MKGTHATVAVTIVFGLGALFGATVSFVRENATEVEIPVEHPADSVDHTFDHLRLQQSSAVSGVVNPATSAVPSAETLSDPRMRSALEKNLREVPYAVLKQIYLERQDEQWQRLQERYAQPKELGEEDLDRRSARLFESFRRNGDRSYYVSRGEWKLRGGKSAPYVVLVEYYSSRGEKSEASEATSGRELCYVSTVFLRVGERYASDGQSSCISWVPMRGEHPFAVHSNYNSKRLVPYFDSVSVALPGFGNESDVNSEWYDGSANRWNSIGRIRFDPVSKDEFVSLAKETQLETDGD